MPLLVHPASGASVRFFRSLRIGRAPDNDLVVPERTVSSFHACIQLREGRWFLKDLGSSNGTTLDGAAVEGWAPLTEGAAIAFGAMQGWTVEQLARAAADVVSPWVVESGAGARVRVSDDRLTFGRGTSWDVPSDAGPPGLHAVLFAEDEGMFLMGVGAATVTIDGVLPPESEPAPLRSGSAFTIDGRGYRLLLDDATFSGLAATARTGMPSRAYDGLRITLVDRGEFGDIVVDDGHGEHRFEDQELRFSLLLVLAQELLRQAADGAENLGWLDDETLRIGIWGRRAIENQATSTLAKLMHDTRQMLGRKGIEALFIEKKRGRSRLRLDPRAVTIR